jgi:hypothetical protein
MSKCIESSEERRERREERMSRQCGKVAVVLYILARSLF